MLDKLNGILAETQRLEIQPTVYNVTALSKIYGLARELAGEIVQAQERIRKLEQKTEGGEEKTDPEDGRAGGRGRERIREDLKDV